MTDLSACGVIVAVHTPSLARTSPLLPSSTIAMDVNAGGVAASTRQNSDADCAVPTSSTSLAVIFTGSVDFGISVDCETSKIIGAMLLLNTEFAAPGVP